ncbi:MAG: prepilin-type N-terminal cleavage/methylation domain-containing protein [bacterium]
MMATVFRHRRSGAWPGRIERRAGGFTLIEVIIAIVIITFAGLGIISSLIFARENAELDKQRLTALNVGRLYMEQAKKYYTTVSIEDQVIDDFNNPSITPINATVSVTFYTINTDTGQKLAEISFPDETQSYIVEVVVTWKLAARLSGKTQSVELESIVRRKGA